MLPTPEPTPSSVADLAALGRLWEQHRPRLLAMVERRIDSALRQRVGAEAVLQSAFLDAAREWAAYRRGSPMEPYAWLYRLTLDRLIEEYRRHARPGRDPRRELPWPDDCSAVFGGHLAETGTGPLTAAQRAELADRVNKVLALLPDTDRDILMMRYFDQLSAREIGGVCGLTENAVNVRVFRAIKKLQTIWSKLYGDPESTP
jgi:RNA polymerase sigma-70 factor (ECF subfamily)